MEHVGFSAEDDVECILLEEDCIEEEEEDGDYEFETADGVQYYDSIQMSEAENGEKMNQCHQCGKTYKSKTSLIHHYNVHLGKTTCPVCSQVFSRRPYMLSHLKLKHTLEEQQSYVNNDNWNQMAKL